MRRLPGEGGNGGGTGVWPWPICHVAPPFTLLSTTPPNGPAPIQIVEEFSGSMASAVIAGGAPVTGVAGKPLRVFHVAPESTLRVRMVCDGKLLAGGAAYTA